MNDMGTIIACYQCRSLIINPKGDKCPCGGKMYPGARSLGYNVRIRYGREEDIETEADRENAKVAKGPA